MGVGENGLCEDLIQKKVSGSISYNLEQLFMLLCKRNNLGNSIIHLGLVCYH